MHPAHTLFPGDTSMGAGLSAQLGVSRTARADGPDAALDARKVASLGDLSVPTSLAPWVGARIGVRGDNEAGLTYTGRNIRVDGRHAWKLGEPTLAPTLSLGLGASAIIAERPGQTADQGSVYGGGLDIPVLIGVKSTNDLYSLWIGPRGGFETLSGDIVGPSDPVSNAASTEDVSIQHYYVGFVVGIRAGFRHVHVALELDGAFHRAVGAVGGAELELDVFTLTPGGALIVSF